MATDITDIMKQARSINKLMFSISFPENPLMAHDWYWCANCGQEVMYGLMHNDNERVHFCSVFCGIEWARKDAVKTGIALYPITLMGAVVHVYDAGLTVAGRVRAYSEFEGSQN